MVLCRVIKTNLLLAEIAVFSCRKSAHFFIVSSAIGLNCKLHFIKPVRAESGSFNRPLKKIKKKIR